MRKSINNIILICKKGVRESKYREGRVQKIEAKKIKKGRAEREATEQS